jgi:hypothetical protein
MMLFFHGLLCPLPSLPLIVLVMLPSLSFTWVLVLSTLAT